MAKGRVGFQLEAWKFGVYLLIPIVASVYFAGDPERQKQQADYWQYVKYPANPNTHMKEQIEEMMKQEKQRKVYQQQLMELSKQAQRTTAVDDVASSNDQPQDGQQPKRGWLRWIGLGGS